MKLLHVYADMHLNDEETLIRYAQRRLLSFVYLGVCMDFAPELGTTKEVLFNSYANKDVDGYMDAYCIYPLTKKDNETITNLSS